MTDFLFGVLGSLAVIALLAAGGAIGWNAHRILRKMPEAAEVPAPTAQELERIKEMVADQDAFRRMQNYSVERAYGMLDEDDPFNTKEGES